MKNFVFGVIIAVKFITLNKLWFFDENKNGCDDNGFWAGFFVGMDFYRSCHG